MVQKFKTNTYFIRYEIHQHISKLFWHWESDIIFLEAKKCAISRKKESFFFWGCVTIKTKFALKTILLKYFQCRRKFRSDIVNEGYFIQFWISRMETSGHLPFILRNGRGIFPFWRTDVCHEIWKLDVRWLPGQWFYEKIETAILTCNEGKKS